MIALLAIAAVTVNAQSVKLNGVYQNGRDNDGELESEWIGSLKDEQGNYTGKSLSIVPQGLYTMTWDGTSLTKPVKEPECNKASVYNADGTINYEKALWATDFNLMYANSGAAYVDGKVITVMSRDYQSTTDEELFAVRKWDAKTGNLLSARDKYYPVSANLESAGMSYNPKDGKVYGLFHFTETQLNSAITDDPEYFTDQDDKDWDREGLDDGWAIGTINLNTMEVTQITPGLYYGNYVTFAINSDGRAFALTSGGTNGVIKEDGKMYNIDDELTGASLCEFDLTTGLIMTKEVKKTVDGEEVTEYVSKHPATGYASQAKRQSACFAKSNPNIMYWNGYYNSGKGVNDSGSWTTLSDKEWRTNGKYDPCLYQIDITTGVATRLALIEDRYTFAAMWVDGDDCSDGAGEVTGIQNVKNQQKSQTDNAIYNLNGQRVNAATKGLYIMNGKKFIAQ